MHHIHIASFKTHWMLGHHNCTLIPLQLPPTRLTLQILSHLTLYTPTLLSPQPFVLIHTFSLILPNHGAGEPTLSPGGYTGYSLCHRGSPVYSKSWLWIIQGSAFWSQKPCALLFPLSHGPLRETGIALFRSKCVMSLRIDKEGRRKTELRFLARSYPFLCTTFPLCVAGWVRPIPKGSCYLQYGMQVYFHRYCNNSTPMFLFNKYTDLDQDLGLIPNVCSVPVGILEQDGLTHTCSFWTCIGTIT